MHLLCYHCIPFIFLPPIRFLCCSVLCDSFLCQFHQLGRFIVFFVASLFSFFSLFSLFLLSYDFFSIKETSTSFIPAFPVPAANVIPDPDVVSDEKWDDLDATLANEFAGRQVNAQSVELSHRCCEAV